MIIGLLCLQSLRNHLHMITDSTVIYVLSLYLYTFRIYLVNIWWNAMTPWIESGSSSILNMHWFNLYEACGGVLLWEIQDAVPNCEGYPASSCFCRECCHGLVLAAYALGATTTGFLLQLLLCVAPLLHVQVLARGKRPLTSLTTRTKFIHIPTYKKSLDMWEHMEISILTFWLWLQAPNESKAIILPALWQDLSRGENFWIFLCHRNFSQK